MDCSSKTECVEITNRIGAKRLLQITGSQATERFTGPQIRRFYKTDSPAYEKTARIHLVSSFMASILSGADAGIDQGDGAGMNLLDLARGQWHQDLLDAVAPDLASKLPKVLPCDKVIGNIAPYFTEKYGFLPSTQINVFSGDNPCSLIGMGGGPEHDG